MEKHGSPLFCAIYSTVHPPSLLYCNRCLGTTGYVVSCCYGMCLIQSDSRAVSACLSRTVRSPAGLCLTLCLFPQDTGSFRMQLSSKRPIRDFCRLSAQAELYRSRYIEVIVLCWIFGFRVSAGESPETMFYLQLTADSKMRTVVKKTL